MSSVVSVKVAHIRPHYQNLKDWMDDPNNVYIGRKGVVFVNGQRFPKKDSMWANPFKIGRDGNREEVINLYRIYLEQEICDGRISVSDLMLLRDKTLGCWCKPDLCHGDVLVEMINKLE